MRGSSRMWAWWLAMVAGSGAAVAAEPSPPAFPGAEGFGATSVGGRGGRVIKVTNLEPKGPGSLQWAGGQEGPRTGMALP
jgi:pectate lyase